ncbi:MAG TPA: flagellar hook-length control protein FliK [Burkholderiales bacterium]
MHIVSSALTPTMSKSTAPIDDNAGAEQIPFTELLGVQMEAGLATDIANAADTNVIEAETTADVAATDGQIIDPAALGLAPAPTASVADSSPNVALDRLGKLETATTQKTTDALKTAIDGRDAKSASRADAKGISIAATIKDSATPSVAASAKAIPQFELPAIASAEAAAPTHPVHLQQGVERVAQQAAMTLQQPVGSERWNNELGQSVNLLVRADQSSATLHVTPPDLGPIDVKIDMAGDKATLTFTVQNPDTRNALENAMPRLRDLLADGGIALGDAHVNQQSGEQRDAPAHSQRQGGGETIALIGTALGTTAANIRVGLVDTFA